MTTSNQFVERYIGNGAMGQVYELIGHKPPAVIKYMLCGSDERLKFFKNECEALKKIYHEYVVRLYRYTEEGKTVGIVMEYCQKGPLKGVILDPTITYSMNTVLTWGIQLFDAIDHMYQKHKLVHRDIKPDNIFVTIKYQLKIGDFGLVKVVEDGTVTGTFIGTPRYMSPPEMKEDRVQRDIYEQIKEADVSNSHRNDVYSLGLVMWEIVERRVAFSQYDREGFFDRDVLLIAIALRRYLEIELPNCQAELRKIILRCTSFRRFLRPNAGDALELLRRIATNDPFISTLFFLPKEDKQQESLIRPIGFNGEIDEIVVAYDRDTKEIFQLSDATLTNNEGIRAIAKLEDFERSNTISRGGYGTAYLHGTNNGQRTLIKIIDLPNQIDRQKEYEILAKLRHQNVIAHLKTWQLSDKEIGIEMEYCDRGTLKDVRDGPLFVFSFDTIIYWSIQLFDALTYLHLHSIIHGDIKPSSIFVTKHFVMKLGDFDTCSKMAEEWPALGTPRYRSPEQKIENEDWEMKDPEEMKEIWLHEKNDVYGMGLVIYELIQREFRVISSVFIFYELNPKIYIYVDRNVQNVYLPNKFHVYDSEYQLIRPKVKDDVKVGDVVIKIAPDQPKTTLENMFDFDSFNFSDHTVGMGPDSAENSEQSKPSEFPSEQSKPSEIPPEQSKPIRKFSLGKDEGPLWPFSIPLCFLKESDITERANEAKEKYLKKRLLLSGQDLKQFNKEIPKIYKEKRLEHILFQDFDFHLGDSVDDLVDETIESLYRKHLHWYFCAQLHKHYRLIPENPTKDNYEMWERNV